MGGTNLRAAVISREGKMLEKISAATNPELGRESLMGEMVAAIDDLRSRWGTGELAGIGLGVPGFISLKEGVIRNSNNLACLEDFPFRDEMERRLKTRVVLENDANAAALGEKWMGAGRDVDDLVLFTLGTGIGGGIISGGKVLHGFLGMAGELGHMTVVPNGIPCGCGNHGCVEKHASATAISSDGARAGAGRESELPRKSTSWPRRATKTHGGFSNRMGEALGIAAGHDGEHVQFSAVSVERRRAGGVGLVRAGDAGGSAAPVVHVSHHQHASGDRPSWETKPGCMARLIFPGPSRYEVDDVDGHRCRHRRHARAGGGRARKDPRQLHRAARRHAHGAAAVGRAAAGKLVGCRGRSHSRRARGRPRSPGATCAASVSPARCTAW